MTLENKKLLIVEDNVAEAIYAQAEAVKVGFRNIQLVQTLGKFYEVLNYKRNFDYILTDLFFPLGEVISEFTISDYLLNVTQFYDSYADKIFRKIDKNSSPVLGAVNTVSDVMGISPLTYVSEVLPKLDVPEIVLEKAQDAVYGRENSGKYKEFQTILDKIKSGENFPSGYYVSLAAYEEKIPTVIVTSTYHHDIAFEPIRDRLYCPYVDTMIDDEYGGKRKDWKQGLEILLQQRR